MATLLALGVTMGWAADSRPAGSIPRVTLRVTNEAGADRGSLLQASKMAVGIFRHAGIKLVWLDCSGPTAWASGNPCQGERGPAEFWVHIAKQKPAMVSENGLGFSVIDNITGDGWAGVCFPAAAKVAHTWEARVGDILGAAIVHETGHLILGPKSHSYFGVMSAHWARPEFDRIRIAELNFDSGQEERLREVVERWILAMTVSKPE